MKVGSRCGCYEAVESLVGRAWLDNTVIPIRQRLYRRATSRRPLPKVTTLLYPAGRGSGDVRLRAWFWMHIEATIRVRLGNPPLVAVSPREWARRLHVIDEGSYRDEVAERGARRINNALRSLAAARHIRWAGNAWLVLDDRRGGRTGLKVESPAEVAERLKERSELAAVMRYGLDDVRYNGGGAWEDAPIEVPAALWANGWVSALRGSSLVVLLYLLDQRRQVGAGEAQEFEPRRVRLNYYGITEDIWDRARHDLEAHDLLRRELIGHAGAVPRYKLTLDDDTLRTKQAC